MPFETIICLAQKLCVSPLLWTLNVSYDLRKPGRNYESLIKYLESFPGYCHALESEWFIVTDKSPEKVLNEAMAHVDSNDGIVVVRSSAPGAWVNLPESVSRWLERNL